MSQPIRYGLADADLGRIHPQADGHLVMWSDYAALAAEKADTLMVMAKLHMEYRRLQAENERLRSASFVTAVPSEEYEKLTAENERLRKAGDVMAKSLEFGIPANRSQKIAAWLAAKEGGDAK